MEYCLFCKYYYFSNIIESSYSKVNYFLVSLLLLFSFQVRIFFVASFDFFIHHVEQIKSDLKYCQINIPLLLILEFTLEILLFGCLIVINFSCIKSVYWYLISVAWQRGSKYYLSYPIGSNVFIWASNWFKPKNNQIFTNFLLSLFIILIFSNLSLRLKDKSKIIFSVVNILFMWIIFFITGPTPRFGMRFF